MLDLVSLAREVEFACDTGANGVAFPGFASEWWKLTEDEIDRAAEIVIAAADSRIPVILNITAQATCHAVAAAKRFTGMGCQGLMCLPPFVGGTTGSGDLPARGSGPRIVIPAIHAAMVAIARRKRNRVAGSRELERHFPHCQAVKVDFAPPATHGDPVGRRVRPRAVYLYDRICRARTAGCPRARSAWADGRLRPSRAGYCWSFALLKRASRRARAFSRLEILLQFEMKTIHTSIATHKWLLKRQGIFRDSRVRSPGLEFDEAQLPN